MCTRSMACCRRLCAQVAPSASAWITPTCCFVACVRRASESVKLSDRCAGSRVCCRRLASDGRDSVAGRPDFHRPSALTVERRGCRPVVVLGSEPLRAVVVAGTGRAPSCASDDAAPPSPPCFFNRVLEGGERASPVGTSSEVGGGRPDPTGGQVVGQPVVPAAHPTHWPMRRVPAVWVLFARPTMASGEARAQAQGGAAPAVGPARPPHAPVVRTRAARRSRDTRLVTCCLVRAQAHDAEKRGARRAEHRAPCGLRMLPASPHAHLAVQACTRGMAATAAGTNYITSGFMTSTNFF